MRRRTVLAVCGAGLGSLPGCLAAGGGDDPTPSTTETPSPDTTTGPETSLAVSVRALQPVVVVLVTPDSIGVRGDSASQYLALHVWVTRGTAPDSDAFAFQFDGATHERVSRVEDLWATVHSGEAPYDADEGLGWLLFELPDSGHASDAALTWPDGTWRPPRSLRRRLATPSPPLTLDWTVPDTVTPGATPTLAFTVTNDADVPGQFVAALDRAGPQIASAPLAAVSRTVPADSTRRFEYTDTLDVPDPGPSKRDDGSPDMTYRLAWTGGRMKRAVRVVSHD